MSRPAARPAPPRRRPTAARRKQHLSLPSLPLPLVGGVLALALLGGLGYLLWPRPKPPELVGVAPDRIEAGQTVTLSGKHFAKDPAANTVLFGAARGMVSAASESQLKVVVPPDAKPQVEVTVTTKVGRSKAVRLEVLPVATASAVDPDVGLPGQSVTIRGDGFTPDRVTVRFAGLPAASVQEVPGGLKVVVPQIAFPEGTATTVTVATHGQPPLSFPFIVGRLPLILGVKPTKGAIGEKVVLEGRGFAPQPRGNSVTVGGKPALVLAASARALTVVVPAPPAGELSPDLPIVVNALGRASSGRTNFTYLRSSNSAFLLHFFAEPASEYPKDDFAFVSTELGPAVLLGGAAGAASTAARAAALADALNAAVGGAATRRPAFELRERPAPSVLLVGDRRPLLVATSADAAAYSRPWLAERAARGVTPAAVARHWTALLQDYFALFLYRERPLRMLTLNPAARALSDIYGEASRRAPGATNVPSSIVQPTPPSMAAALRQMALQVSSGGGRAAIAIEGTWRGTIQDPDRGLRRFRVVIRSENGRLGGSITTGHGALELTSQLRDVSFDQGRIRFTAELEGAPHQFTGTLENATVSGTIARPRRDPASFTMDFVQ